MHTITPLNPPPTLSPHHTPVYSHQGGYTPLWKACREGHVEVVRLLLDAGSKAIDTASDVSVCVLQMRALRAWMGMR